ncbi:MAG TPA: MFS transporter [Dehalococcoidia bacterium]|nr:MFS transporter [Dehalococcoidia bacterium]
MTLEGMASLGFFSITTSGFLAAFALALGANNLQIGILAAIPFLAQPLQIAAIPLVEKIRLRKVIAVGIWIPAQLLWIPIALIPFFLDVPGAGAISMLLGLLAIRGILVAISNCAWNGWIRDLIPQHILGSIIGRRLALAALAGMVFGLAAAFFVDWWKGQATPDSEVMGYTIALLFGIATLALSGTVFMALMPEPLMQAPPEPKPSLVSTIAAPFRDKNYRKLLRFLFVWGLAINLATPFFAVYMLQRLGLPLSAVIGFSVLSQAFNIMFLRVWGRLADQFGHKAVLSLCVSLYMLVILGWVFTTMPERYFLTIPLLVILHMMAGIAAAGVALGTGTIGIKLAPQGQSTAYLAGAGLAINLGAGIGPLLGGYFADYFSVRQLSLTFEWLSPGSHFEIGALSLTGFDFLFGITFILGLLTLTLLSGVREEGEAKRETVLDALHAPMRELSRPFSTVAGLNFLSQFPYGYLRRVPMPGLDVALGVTVYQIAEISRLAASATKRGRSTTAMIAKSLEEGLSGLKSASIEIRKSYGREVSRQAARGSIHAFDKTAKKSVGKLAYQATLGVVKAMRHTRVDPKDAIRGAGYGVVEGAGEIQADLGEVAIQAVKAAKEIASDVGITEEAAVAEAASGAFEAAEALGQDALAQVRAAIPEQIVETQAPAPEKEGEKQGRGEE